MNYDKRNRDNINKLAYHTRLKAIEWYNYCIRNNINILIYETIRDEQTQRKYVREGKSKTMKSYHLVGQALDFVPVNNNGEALWNGYEDKKIKQAINKAKRIGFTWGGDWKGFIDKPHLQYEYKGYGTDSFNIPSNENNTVDTVNINELVQKTLRGEFGNGEERKRKLGKYYKQVQDIINKRLL